MADTGKDLWDKVDIVFRPLNGLLTALAVALLGYFTSATLREGETRQTNERVYTELVSSREQAESGLRKDMFLSIIDTFLQPQSAGLEAKMLNLELLTYNFHESLNLQPLFAHMNRQITASNEPKKEEYVTRLNQVARDVSARQLVLLEQVGQKFSRSVDLAKLKAEGYLELPPEKLTLDKIEREFMITVFEADAESGELTLELGIRTPKESSSMQLRKFRVGFYDFPMIDNTRLSNDQRAAVVLTQSNADSAELTLVYFRGSYSMKEKVSYDEVVEKLRSLEPDEAQ